MAPYQIDRKLLESKSTEEILRIIKKERDDYTPEAIAILEEILKTRDAEPLSARSDGLKPPAERIQTHEAPRLAVHSPSDAVNELNNLLSGVLNGTMDPQVAQVASNIVMAILRAMEMSYMQEPEEGS